MPIIQRLHYIFPNLSYCEQKIGGRKRCWGSKWGILKLRFYINSLLVFLAVTEALKWPKRLDKFRIEIDNPLIIIYNEGEDLELDDWWYSEASNGNKEYVNRVISAFATANPNKILQYLPNNVLFLTLYKGFWILTFRRCSYYLQCH